MKTKTLLSLLSFVMIIFASAASAQEPTVPIEGLIPPAQNVMGGMPMIPRINPAVLIRMRDQMTFELQQTQRQLNFIDTNDTQLRESFTERQNELVKQIKDINEQLKAAGGLPEETADRKRQTAETLPNVMPNLQRHDPALFSGGNPVPPIGGLTPPALTNQPTALSNNLPALPNNPLPAEFDQEQAFANSPWIPQPSKELTDLKKSVEALRKETEDLKTSIKALEAQIQLLNRNILLNQGNK